jgi:hypothetical protein
MSEDIAKTPNLANGMLVGSVAMFPVIRGAFNAVDSIVDAIGRRDLATNAPHYAKKVGLFSELINAKVTDVAPALESTQRELLKIALEQMAERQAWFTTDNIRQAIEDNPGADAYLLQLEFSRWLVEPMRNAIDSLRKKATRSQFRDIELEMIKQASILLNADISRSGEPNYGLRQLGKTIFQVAMFVLIPLAAVVMVMVAAS